MSALLQSKPCPCCGKRILLPVTEEEASAYYDGAPIQIALANRSAEIRERYVSGFCPTCWKKQFGSDGASPSGSRQQGDPLP